MTGLRAIEATIPSTLHTLFRSLRRTHFRRALPRSVRLCNKVRTKYDACMHPCHPRHDGIITDDSKDPRHFAFLVFKAPLTAHALSAVCLGNARQSRDYPIASVSVVHSSGPDASVAYYKVKAGKLTDAYMIHTRVLVIRQRSAYRSVTNPDTTTRTSASPVARRESRVHDAARHRLRFTR